jgi:(d)CTP diphosphatase
VSEVAGKPAHEIAAAVLRRSDGKVLLLKRSLTHTTNPGKWCFVTGYVEPGETPRAAAIRELREELGVEAAPSREGQLVQVNASRAALTVHPFLFEVGDIPITLEHEHTDFVWIEPPELYQYDFVQQLDEDLISLGLL